ncbi:MAG TPA: TIGR01777 family oxidoreductase [Flavobacteriales bacterium]|nr:TIGR01777 family oxidoreductase [Flavobacteriales bacterium]
MTTILITGGSGLVGSHLTKLLLGEGFAVRHLSRSAKPDAPVPTFEWNIAKGFIDPRALENVDHIIHLSGVGIADERWTEERMRVLYSSRVDAAALLHREMGMAGAWPKSFISASGINYYGTHTSDQVFNEEDPPANDTLGKLCQSWEGAANDWAAQCRVVTLRTSVVLAREGGALSKLAGPARWGLASPLGHGRQWMPWVHIDDLARAYLHVIRNAEMHGAYNIAAPEDVRNREMMREVAHALHHPYLFPAVPRFVLRAMLGELSSMVLEGSRVSNAKLVASGFELRHPELKEALKGLLQ